MVKTRPRTVSLPEEDIIKLGKEMVAWVEENQPIHLKQWYSFEKLFTYNQWKQIINKEEFHPYYEKALGIVSLKYLDGTIPPAIAQRWQRVYFKDVKEEENEILQNETDKRKEIIDHQAKVAKDAVSGIDNNVIESLQNFMTFISDAQSARKIADNNIKTDKKS